MRCAFLPCVQRQSRFAAGLFEEHRSIPVVFNRHLREQQAAMSGHSDDQAVAADFDGVRRK